jgi:transglutaminase-like putative cysteine protease
MVFLTIFLIAVQRHHSEPHAYRQAYADRRSYSVRLQTHATHAWEEVLLPKISWLGVDPMNNVLTGEHRITVATWRDYAEVTPKHGI